jgi:hypothetical protein
MRRLVVVLLLVNIAFFALMRWGGEGQSAQPLAALNPEKMKLLGQPAQPLPAASAVAAVSAPPVPPVVPALSAAAPAPRTAEKSCLEWGEFSGFDLARAEKALAQMKLGDKLGQRAVEYTHGYWVYLPPFKTPAGKAKKIRQLKELGITDYFVVQEAGLWMNAISLGVFKTEEAANNYLAELNKRGLNIGKVGERASRLKFTVFVFRHMDAAGVAQLTALQRDYAGSEMKPVACGK